MPGSPATATRRGGGVQAVTRRMPAAPARPIVVRSVVVGSVVQENERLAAGDGGRQRFHHRGVEHDA